MAFPYHMYYSSKELQSLMKRQGLSTKDVLSEGEGGGLEKKDKIAQFERMSFVDGPTEPDIFTSVGEYRVNYTWISMGENRITTNNSFEPAIKNTAKNRKFV